MLSCPILHVCWHGNMVWWRNEEEKNVVIRCQDFTNTASDYNALLCSFLVENQIVIIIYCFIPAFFVWLHSANGNHGDENMWFLFAQLLKQYRQIDHLWLHRGVASAQYFFRHYGPGRGNVWTVWIQELYSKSLQPKGLVMAHLSNISFTCRNVTSSIT